MNIEKILQFFADEIDAELIVCDDGYVICVEFLCDINNPRKTPRLDFVFDEHGKFQGIKTCKYIN